LLQALALAERIKTAMPGERDALLVQLDDCHRWMAARAEGAPANYRHLAQWIEAERAWATGEHWAAIANFETALRAAQTRPWHQALLYERAGLCHAALGLDSSAHGLLAEAHRCYEAWGASGKAAEMARHQRLTQTALGVRRKSSSTSITSDSIDLVGIL